MCILNIILLVFCIVHGILGNVSTSSYKYRQFLENRVNFRNKIEEYIQYEKDRLIDLKKSSGYDQEILYVNVRIEHLEDLLKEAQKNTTESKEEPVDDIIAHPVKAFINIKNFVINYRTKFLNETLYGEKYRKILDCPDFNTPLYSDQRDSIQAILRLQAVHQIPAETIMAGKFMGSNSPTLNAADAYILGAHAHSLFFMSLAAEWLDLAWDSLNGDISNAIFDWHDALKRRISAYTSLPDKYGQVEDLINIGMELDEKANTGNQFYKLSLKRRQNKLKKEPDNLSSTVWEMRRALCNQQHYLPESNTTNLRCKYRPAMAIPTYNRYKEEVLNNKPYISLIHEVLTDKEVQNIKETAGPKLWLSKERDRSFGEIAALNRGENDVTRLVASKLTHTLRFAPKPRDQLLVWNYGLAGHKEERQKDRSKHNTGGSFLIFLSDIEKGSHIVFKNLKISVKPQKGSMVYWFSKDSRSHDEVRRQKYSCPVVFGEKWEMEANIRKTDYTRTCKKRRKSKQV